jgi:DNA polymerase-3 subunit alpha
MAGVVDFYKECKKANIKPIIGVEAYVTDDKDDLFNENKTRDNMHMVLLAKTDEGYRRLLRLISHAALHNFYYKPRIYREHLRTLQGHVIATTACLGGIVAKRLHFETDQYHRAIACVDENNIVAREIQFYRNIFRDDFYLELQVWDNDDRFQPVYNQFLLQLGEEQNLPFVLTADAHYLKQGDDKLHELLMAMQMKMPLEEYQDNSDMLYGPHFYVAGPEEMMSRAQSISCVEAYHNTQKIAEQCNVEIKLGKYQEPEFKIEETEDYEEFLEWKEQHAALTTDNP